MQFEPETDFFESIQDEDTRNYDSTEEEDIDITLPSEVSTNVLLVRTEDLGKEFVLIF
jgi:hypothetical protein